MPVLGHAFVGLATADVTRPAGGSSDRLGLWSPVVVGLAYSPDIAGQLLTALSFVTAARVSHSLVLALPAAAVAAVLLHHWLPVSLLRALAVALASIVLHDVADLLAGGHHLTLWWPLSSTPVVFGESRLTMPLELLFFGGAYAALRGLCWFRRRRRDPSQEPVTFGHRSHPNWAGWAMTGAILLCAAGTHYLRDVRERQFHTARKMIAEKQYAAALAALDQAERWPATAHASRLDYARAEAYAAMGDRTRAEQHYLRSYRADPSYFWVVADLAVFYASADEPVHVRRRRVAPYLHQMTTEFAHVKALPRCLARLERKLAGHMAVPGENNP